MGALGGAVGEGVAAEVLAAAAGAEVAQSGVGCTGSSRRGAGLVQPSGPQTAPSSRTAADGAWPLSSPIYMITFCLSPSWGTPSVFRRLRRPLLSLEATIARSSGTAVTMPSTAVDPSPSAFSFASRPLISSPWLSMGDDVAVLSAGTTVPPDSKKVMRSSSDHESMRSSYRMSSQRRSACSSAMRCLDGITLELLRTPARGRRRPRVVLPRKWPSASQVADGKELANLLFTPQNYFWSRRGWIPCVYNVAPAPLSLGICPFSLVCVSRHFCTCFWDLHHVASPIRFRSGDL